MRKSPWKFQIWLILFLLILTSCTEEEKVPTASLGTVAAPTSSIKPTDSPGVIPSITPSPILPLITPTKAMNKERIGELIKDNEKCTFPCFWGIIPEKTSLQEAKTELENLGLNLLPTIPEYYSIGFSSDRNLGGEIVIHEKENVVQSVRVDIVGLDHPSYSPKDWQAFTIQEILTQYGLPSAIRLVFQYPHEKSNNPPSISVDYILYYDDLNFTVIYSSRLINTNEKNKYHLCPGGNEFRSLRTYYGKYPDKPQKNIGWDIKDVLGFDANGFSKLIFENKCVDISQGAIR